jgi:hypothetical protein
MIYELNEEVSSYEYFSERVPQILGCNGLLMTNSNFSNFLKKDEDYIYIDKNIDWFEKIITIVSNSEKYDNVRKSGFEKALENYQWSNWATTFINNL